MPELPEVETAARRLRLAAVGRCIVRVRTLHAATRRALADDAAAAFAGRRILAVERWAKYQTLLLDDGAALEAHFRMTGDWHFGPTAESGAVRYARAAIDLDDVTTVTLVDSRGLGTLRRIAPGTPPPVRAPDALAPDFDARYFTAALANRRQAIKPALLDQGVVGGVGNIYASEALWRAGIDPRTPAGTLSPRRVARLAAAVRETLTDALERPGRYADGEAVDRFAVYDRGGEPCRRCERGLTRIVQAGRSTYFCTRCQRG